MSRFKFKFQTGERKRYGLAAAAGLVLAAAFPKIGMAGMAWVAPGMMLMAALGWNGGAAFRIGYVAGLAFYLASLYWLLLIPVSVAPIVGWLALAAYLAVYPGVWVWLCWKLYPALQSPISNLRSSIPEPPEPLPSGAGVSPASEGSRARRPDGRRDACPTTLSGRLCDLLDRFLDPPWHERFRWGLLCAALWVGLEMILSRLFTGFPWGFLGISQYRILPLIQIASVTGVYGVSFLVAWFSVSLASALIMLVRRPQARGHAHRELVAPFFVAAALVAVGWFQIIRPNPPRPILKLALVQPSIPQTWIWDANESSNRFQQLIQLSEQALTNHPDVLVWPEAAVPEVFKFGNQFNDQIYLPVAKLARDHRVWVVIGGDEAEVRTRANGRLETNYFNSSFLIAPSAEVVASYRKRRLVIFGEYVPFGRQFPFIGALTGLGSFTPGDRPGFFSMPNLHVKATLLICFEDAFPHLTRASVDDETDFLLNLTNNGWFGESAAQWQHAATAVFRAVENGLPLVRCANNGLTCWVDAHGQINETFFPNTRDIYGVGCKIAQVPLLGGQKRAPTFYRRHGDWFGWGCVGLSAAAVLSVWVRRRQILKK